MILVDTSFLVAFFNEDDTQHTKAIKDMKQYDDEKQEFLITEHVLGETATVLLYRKGLTAAKQFLEFSKEKCNVETWNSDDFYATLELFENQSFELSYIDASIGYLALRLNVPLACYDNDLLDELKLKKSKKI